MTDRFRAWWESGTFTDRALFVFVMAGLFSLFFKWSMFMFGICLLLLAEVYYYWGEQEWTFRRAFFSWLGFMAVVVLAMIVFITGDVK